MRSCAAGAAPLCLRRHGCGVGERERERADRRVLARPRDVGR